MNDSISTIKYNGNIFVAGLNAGTGSGSKRIAYSEDGKNWTESTSGSNIFSVSSVKTIVWNGKLFVAGGNSGKLAYSEDGINWTESTSGSNIFSVTVNIINIIWNDNIFVGYSNTANRVFYSEDGKTWKIASSANNILYTQYILTIACNDTLPNYIEFLPTESSDTQEYEVHIPDTSIILDKNEKLYFNIGVYNDDVKDISIKLI